MGHQSRNVSLAHPLPQTKGSAIAHFPWAALVTCSRTGHPIPDPSKFGAEIFFLSLLSVVRRIGKTAYDGVSEVEMKVLNTDSNQKAE